MVMNTKTWNELKALLKAKYKHIAYYNDKRKNHRRIKFSVSISKEEQNNLIKFCEENGFKVNIYNALYNEFTANFSL